MKSLRRKIDDADERAEDRLGTMTVAHTAFGSCVHINTCKFC